MKDVNISAAELEPSLKFVYIRRWFRVPFSPFSKVAILFLSFDSLTAASTMFETSYDKPLFVKIALSRTFRNHLILQSVTCTHKMALKSQNDANLINYQSSRKKVLKGGHPIRAVIKLTELKGRQPIRAVVKLTVKIRIQKQSMCIFLTFFSSQFHDFPKPHFFPWLSRAWKIIFKFNNFSRT